MVRHLEPMAAPIGSGPAHNSPHIKAECGAFLGFYTEFVPSLFISKTQSTVNFMNLTCTGPL